MATKYEILEAARPIPAVLVIREQETTEPSKEVAWFYDARMARKFCDWLNMRADCEDCGELDPELGVPAEIIEAALIIGNWAEAQGGRYWRLFGICDRRWSEA